MKQQLHLVSLGVSDVAASGGCYCDGLGFELDSDFGTVVTVQVGNSQALALITSEDLATDMGIAVSPPPTGSMVTLAHNVESKEAVDGFMALAAQAGAVVIKPPQTAEWGGYSGYFKDPDRHVWEVAAADVAFEESGQAVLG